jgi:hypothetical protein
LRLQRLSVSIDPLNPDGYQNGGIIHYMLRNFDAAEKELRESMRISPTFTGTHWYLGQIFLLRGGRTGGAPGNAGRFPQRA